MVEGKNWVLCVARPKQGGLRKTRAKYGAFLSETCKQGADTTQPESLTGSDDDDTAVIQVTQECVNELKTVNRATSAVKKWVGNAYA